MEQLVNELIAIKSMLKELEGQKKALENTLKDLTENGPLNLNDGRTVQTVSTTREIIDTNKVKEFGLFDELKKIVIVKTIKIK